MWIYFNSEGELIQNLEHGNPARVGTTDYDIFAYFEDIDLDYYSVATIRFKKPDLDRTEYPTLFMIRKDRKFVQTSEDPSTCSFSNNQTYSGFYFSFSNFAGDEDIATLLDTPGQWEATITLYNSSRTRSVQGLINFYVQASVSSLDDEETEISETEVLDNLISIVLSKSQTIWMRSTRNFTIKASNKQLDSTLYFVGCYVYDETTNCIYKITEIIEDPENINFVGARHIIVVSLNQVANALIFKGTATVKEINELETIQMGDFYNIIGSGYEPESWVVNPGNVTVAVGDLVAYSDNNEWEKLGNTMDLTLYVKKTDIVDNLTSTSLINPLSANQGRILSETRVRKDFVVNPENTTVLELYNLIRDYSPAIINVLATLNVSGGYYIGSISDSGGAYEGKFYNIGTSTVVQFLVSGSVSVETAFSQKTIFTNTDSFRLNRIGISAENGKINIDNVARRYSEGKTITLTTLLNKVENINMPFVLCIGSEVQTTGRYLCWCTTSYLTFFELGTGKAYYISYYDYGAQTLEQVFVNKYNCIGESFATTISQGSSKIPTSDAVYNFVSAFAQGTNVATSISSTTTINDLFNGTLIPNAKKLVTIPAISGGIPTMVEIEYQNGTGALTHAITFLIDKPINSSQQISIFYYGSSDGILSESLYNIFYTALGSRSDTLLGYYNVYDNRKYYLHDLEVSNAQNSKLRFQLVTHSSSQITTGALLVANDTSSSVPKSSKAFKPCYYKYYNSNLVRIGWITGISSSSIDFIYDGAEATSSMVISSIVDTVTEL